MKSLLGILLIIVGVALGIYVGVWLCFIGGICDLVDVVNQAAKHQTDISGMQVAGGVAKIVFAGVAGMASAFLCIIPGMTLTVKR